MKKVLILGLVLFFSLSFGQIKKKRTKTIKVDTTTVGLSQKIITNKDIKNHTIEMNPTFPIEDETIYNTAGIEVKPEFPGGSEKLFSFISKNFHYSDEMKQNELQGRIFASFIVEKDGSISDIKIIRGLGYDTENEVLRVLKLMPKWIAGEQNGEKVRCSYQIPIQINGKQ